MANISIKINLRQLKHVVRTMNGQNGQKIECLVLPIVQNMMHVGEKGVYMDFTAIEIKNKVGDSKDTHLIKQAIPKEIYEVMSEEEKMAQPIIGNAILWGRREPDPVNADIGDTPQEENDDLPF